ncbi:MAG: amidohydrolase family protein [Pseudomonadota bacterium]
MNRRELLTGVVAAAGAACVPRTSSAARPDGYVDVHHHVFPPQYIAVARQHSVNPAAIEQWTLARTLDEMDRNNVQTAIVSITQPGVWFGDAAQSAQLARECNEYMARLVVDHPGRFGFFASLPVGDTDASLREIEYSLDTLHADGIGLMTSHGALWPGDSHFSPLLGELNRRAQVVYFHPTGADCCRSLMPYVTPNLIEYPHDTARAIASLLFSGSFVRYRDIRFVFSHAGGTLPVLAGRIGQLATPQQKAANMPQGLEYELRRLYYEVANAANRAAIGALTSLVPLSQLLLGSDYPYVPISVTSDGLARLHFSANELRAVRGGNARALLARWRV